MAVNKECEILEGENEGKNVSRKRQKKTKQMIELINLTNVAYKVFSWKLSHHTKKIDRKFEEYNIALRGCFRGS